MKNNNFLFHKFKNTQKDIKICERSKQEQLKYLQMIKSTDKCKTHSKKTTNTGMEMNEEEKREVELKILSRLYREFLRIEGEFKDQGIIIHIFTPEIQIDVVTIENNKKRGEE